MGGKLPLSYYNLINEDITRNDVPKEKDYGQIPGVNQDVPNPNAINRPLAWPIRVKSSICPDIKVGFSLSGQMMISFEHKEEIIELIITSLEKLHWQNTEIAFFLKVIITILNVYVEV